MHPKLELLWLGCPTSPEHQRALCLDHELHVDSAGQLKVKHARHGAYACLIDKSRVEAFRKTINEVVKVGDVVLEVRAGTGILSRFAASAGAK